MYLRIRRLGTNTPKQGDYVVMLARQGVGTSIAMFPGQLEWWDGLEWHEVKIVEEDADKRSPYA